MFSCQKKISRGRQGLVLRADYSHGVEFQVSAMEGSIQSLGVSQKPTHHTSCCLGVLWE